MDWLFYVTGAFVVIMTGVSKSGFAGGLTVLSVPLLSIFIAPQVAAAIMLPILCIIDISNIWHYRKDWVRRIVYLLIPGAIIGITIGTLTFSVVNENLVKIAVGAIALWFAAIGLLNINAKRQAKPMGVGLGLFFGALAGFTSFVAHAGGPPIKGFLLSQNLPKSPFVATNSVFFFAMNQMKLIPYFFLGQFSVENLTLSLILLPFVPVGLLLGYHLHRVISQEYFSRLVGSLLVLAGLKLLYDGISNF